MKKTKLEDEVIFKNVGIQYLNNFGFQMRFQSLFLHINCQWFELTKNKWEIELFSASKLKLL